MPANFPKRLFISEADKCIGICMLIVPCIQVCITRRCKKVCRHVCGYSYTKVNETENMWARNRE